jgi:hypothetical protein
MQRYLVGEWLFVGRDAKVVNCDNHVSFVNVMGRSSHKDYHVNEMHPCVTNGLGDGQLMVSHATQTTHGFTYQQRTKVLTTMSLYVTWFFQCYSFLRRIVSWPKIFWDTLGNVMS